MKLFHKIYLVFILLIFVFLGGLTLYGAINKNNVSSSQNNKSVDNPKNTDLNTMTKHLEALQKQNQAKIEEATKIQKEDEALSQQIKFNLGLINDFIKTIKTLNDEKEIKEKNLKENQNLTSEEKEKLTKEIEDKNQEIKTQGEKKDKLNEETRDLIEKRKALNTKQTDTQNTIKQTQLNIKTTSNLTHFITEIKQLEEAMKYNEAEKEQIKTLLNQYKDNAEEVNKLTNYNLFLDNQLLSFDKQITQLTKKIEDIQVNKPLVVDKKKKNFSKCLWHGRRKRSFRQYHSLFKSE